jgi:hypothetical protein
MITTHGYQTASFSRTFDCYDHVDCYNFMDVHDELKLIKHGYSKVTDHASREIRHGRLDRLTAERLVQRHQQAPLKYLDKFCSWLGVEQRALQFIFNQHRNPRFWHQTSPGQWAFRSAVGDSAGQLPSCDTDRIEFTANSTLNRGETDGYITIGKGHPT